MLPPNLPNISLIVPCFKVAKYLPDFLKSLARQRVPKDEFEVIFVVDGCPEQSEKVIRDWQIGQDLQSTLVVTENLGVSAARNTGLELARGTWVTFPDPDDLLDEKYLETVLRDIRANSDCHLLMTRLARTDSQCVRELPHPLDYRYRGGSRTFLLSDEPEILQLAVHTAVFRRTTIENMKIRFDMNLAIFEDAKFVAEYLLSWEEPRIRLSVEAIYLYRTRDDATGALESSASNFPSRYMLSMRFGHAELLELAGETPPLWLEYMILYDLYWLFHASQSMGHQIHGADSSELSMLSGQAKRILRSLTLRALLTFRIVSVSPEIRSAWLRLNEGRISQRWVRRYRVDLAAQVAEFRYLTATSDEEVSITVGGESVEPEYEKWRTVHFFGDLILFERVIWVRHGDETVFELVEGEGEGFAFGGSPLSDAEITLRFGWQQPEPLSIKDRVLPGLLFRLISVLRRNFGKLFRQNLGKLASKAAVLPAIGHRYRNGWLLMDRDSHARDNAEALYRYLMDSRGACPIHFVLRRSSPDYLRLKQAGFALIPFGGIRHFIALRNASHLLSSHADEYVVNTFRRFELEKTWNFVFLQHGVVYNDLHLWLNSKDFQLVISSTENEVQSYVDCFSPYLLTRKEVRLTGLARHDLLYLAMERQELESVRNHILIAPTWRSYLFSGDTAKGNERVPRDGFESSAYVQYWGALLQDSRLRALAERHDLDIDFLPHPNLAPHIGYLGVPPWVRIRSYSEDDVATLIAETTLAVSDYSSITFDVAFCGAPSVYFQFDRDEFYSGTHIGGAGYFDLRDEGFGPVVSTVDEVIAAVEHILRDGIDSEIRQRVLDVFPNRDSSARERIVEEVNQLGPRFGSIAAGTIT